MLKFFFGGVERERERFFRAAQKEQRTESKNEISEKVSEGLDYIKVANEICEYDVLKFTQVYKSVLLADALIVYSRKLEERNKSENNKFKIELMKLEMLGKMITGEDLKLLDKFEDKIEKKEKRIDESVLIKAGFDII